MIKVYDLKEEVRDMGQDGNRRKYDAEFKKEAVRLVVERGLSVKKVAEDLGIQSQYAWQLEKAVSEGSGGIVSWQGACKG